MGQRRWVPSRADMTDEEVRRLQSKEMRPPRRGHCPHRNRHDKVGDSKNAPSVNRSAGASRLSGQQRSHNDGEEPSRDVANPCGRRQLPRQAPVRPKHEEDAAGDAIDLTATIQGSGIAETRLARFPDSHSATAAATRGISRANRTVGTALSVPAKYTFAAPRYWAMASQAMSPPTTRLRSRIATARAPPCGRHLSR